MPKSKNHPPEAEQLSIKTQQLEIEIRHLSNELRLAEEEKESARKNYYEMVAHMEEKVAQRTRETRELQKISQAKGKELEMILDTSPAMIFYKDSQHRYIRVNQQFARNIGVSITRIIGKTFKELFPESADPFYQDDLEVMRSGAPLLNITRTVVTPNGSIEVLTNKIPYKDISGNTIGIIGFALDVTELRRAEQEKRDLEERLLQLEKMDAIGRLASGVAHDLNNVLSAVVSYPDLLMQKIPADSPLKRPIETIRKSGQKAAAIVDDLLTLARRGVPINEVLNLNDIIGAYFEAPEFEKLKQFNPHITFETSLEPELLNIRGSSLHLAKTVMNLAANAAEATLHKGSITISTANCYIEEAMISYDLRILPGDYVMLTVADKGIGIEPADVKRIFEPFYTKKVMGRSGTGLGMAVVWGTVKDHKGNISVSSEKGKGTVIDIYFPATREPLVREKTEVSIQKYLGRGERILVVDDIPEQREITTELLSSLNYEVRTAAGGEAALVYLRENNADLVILDMIMDPGIDGLETFRSIIKFKPGQKALIASGYSETERVREAQRLGAGQYIKKPYTLEKIGLAVRRALDAPPRTPNTM